MVYSHHPKEGRGYELMRSRGSQLTVAYALVSSVQSLGSGLSGFALAALVAHLPTGAWNPFDAILASLAALSLVQIACIGWVGDSSKAIPNAASPMQTVDAPTSSQPRPA